MIYSHLDMVCLDNSGDPKKAPCMLLKVVGSVQPADASPNDQAVKVLLANHLAAQHCSTLFVNLILPSMSSNAYLWLPGKNTAGDSVSPPNVIHSQRVQSLSATGPTQSSEPVMQQCLCVLQQPLLLLWLA